MTHIVKPEGTIHPHYDFNPRRDAEILMKAMRGLGTDEDAIINVLTKRSIAQRLEITTTYKQMYGQSLIDDLKDDLSGDFLHAILALVIPTNDYLASDANWAVVGAGTDEETLVEVLCARTNQEIKDINESYNRLYGHSMEADIIDDTSGDFKRLLVALNTGARSEDPADINKAKQQARELYAAGVDKWGTEESMFNSILARESWQQLALTFKTYKDFANQTVAETIDSEMSGDLRMGMLAIARCVENTPSYFAQRLYKSMKGPGTDERTLTRVVVTRCEVDMVQIKNEYSRHYGETLASAIDDDTSGDYCTTLLNLVNGN